MKAVSRIIDSYGTHGDVQIVNANLLKEKPDFSKMTHLGHNILAEGEVTGHLHALGFDNGATVAKLQLAQGQGAFDLYRDERGTMWVDVRETTALSHQEHLTTNIAPGAYRIGITREYNPFLEQIQQVAD